MKRGREVTQNGHYVPPSSGTRAVANEIEGGELRRRHAVATRRRVDKFDRCVSHVAPDDELDPASANIDGPPRSWHNDLRDLGRLRGSAMEGGRGQKADVIGEAEVGHHWVKEDTPGRCAKSAILQRDDDVETADGRDNQTRRFRSRERRIRARGAHARLPYSSLFGRERVPAQSGQPKHPVPQVAHMQDHTLDVCFCIRTHRRRSPTRSLT